MLKISGKLQEFGNFVQKEVILPLSQLTAAQKASCVCLGTHTGLFPVPFSTMLCLSLHLFLLGTLRKCLEDTKPKVFSKKAELEHEAADLSDCCSGSSSSSPRSKSCRRRASRCLNALFSPSITVIAGIASAINLSVAPLQLVLMPIYVHVGNVLFRFGRQDNKVANVVEDDQQLFSGWDSAREKGTWSTLEYLILTFSGAIVAWSLVGVVVNIVLFAVVYIVATKASSSRNTNAHAKSE
ncbi:unnamed protein product [Amoebophrya sp. A25]|nr:unnamed protein product [Amoebophrya sp. A25]|eukprot:GSA25T00009220001.1